MEHRHLSLRHSKLLSKLPHISASADPGHSLTAPEDPATQHFSLFSPLVHANPGVSRFVQIGPYQAIFAAIFSRACLAGCQFCCRSNRLHTVPVPNFKLSKKNTLCWNRKLSVLNLGLCFERLRHRHCAALRILLGINRDTCGPRHCLLRGVVARATSRDARASKV